MNTFAKVFTGFLLGIFACSIAFALSTTFPRVPATIAARPAATFTPTGTPQVAASPMIADTPTAAPISTPTTATGRITYNQPVTVGYFEYKVLSAKEIGNFLKSNSPAEADRTSTGKFIEVVLTAKNVGGDSNVFENTGGVIDSQGRKFDQIGGDGYFIEAERWCSIFDKIQPTFERTCAVLFEVAADSHGLSIILVDQEIMGTDSVQVWLGG